MKEEILLEKEGMLLEKKISSEQKMEEALNDNIVIKSITNFIK